MNKLLTPFRSYWPGNSDSASIAVTFTVFNVGIYLVLSGGRWGRPREVMDFAGECS